MDGFSIPAPPQGSSELRSHICVRFLSLQDEPLTGKPFSYRLIAIDDDDPLLVHQTVFNFLFYRGCCHTLNTLSLVNLIFGSCYLKELAADVKTFILDPGSICWFSAAHVCNMFTSVDLLKFTNSKPMHHARAYMILGDVGVLCVQCRRQNSILMRFIQEQQMYARS